MNHSNTRRATDLVENLAIFTEIYPSKDCDFKKHEVLYSETSALLKAFGIDVSIDEIFTSNFRNDEIYSRPECQPAYHALSAELKEKFPQIQNVKAEYLIHELHWIVWSMLRFKAKMQPARGFWSGTLEAPPILSRIAYPMTKEVFKKADEIDELIAKILDPLERSFTVQELVEKFGYPEPPPYDPDDDENW